jgi:hypothetical protein
LKEATISLSSSSEERVRVRSRLLLSVLRALPLRGLCASA